MDDQTIEPMNLATLIDDHYQVLYRYAYRLSGSQADAEDLTQQTYLLAQENLNQLRDPSAARGWLFTILRNAYLKSQRSQRHAKTVSLERVGEPEQEEALPKSIDEKSLQKVIDELPDEFRIPLILFYFEEFSYKEIASQLELPTGTVMSRLSRGKEHLRKKLQPETVEVGSSIDIIQK